MTIKNILGAASLAAAASVALSTGAMAADDEMNKFGYSLTITGLSDYLFRGISYTTNQPAFQPYLELTYGKPSLTYYLGIWASNHKNGFYDPFEIDFYAGVRPVIGRFNFDFGVLWYLYPGAHPGGGFGASDLDYVEFKAAGSTTIDKFTLGVTGYITPDVGFAAPVTETIEGSIAYALPKMWIFDPVLSGGVGFTHSETSDFYPTGVYFDTFSRPSGVAGGVREYTYWNAGVKLTVDKWFMDFRYWDTDISKADDPNSLATSRFLFSAGVVLP